MSKLLNMSDTQQGDDIPPGLPGGSHQPSDRSTLGKPVCSMHSFRRLAGYNHGSYVVTRSPGASKAWFAQCDLPVIYPVSMELVSISIGIAFLQDHALLC